MAEVVVRKAELDAVVGVLESDDFEDAKAAARAITKALYNEWRKREWWAVFYRPTPSGPSLFYGLEPSENGARKATGLLSGGVARLVLINPVSVLEERRWEMADEELKRTAQPCVECGHYEWQHGAVGYKGKSVKVPAGKACAMNCKCKKFVGPTADREEGGVS